MKRLFVVVALLACSACTWVKPTEEAEAVRIAESTAEVANCKRLGSTNAMVKSKVTFVKRDQDKVGRELETLARNDAAQMGGNVILNETEMEQGRQTFGIYSCP
ncbi:uncharacterized protein DUF4156 [Alteromonadaceae bacterium 2753L.S.0a.02]|nr:uncharacterized protein DUF4156 [Alteromonadaceae bacterium 2753L.S.0a.02]